MTKTATVLVLALLASCGGLEKPKKNDDWKKPWFQYQSQGPIPILLGTEAEKAPPSQPQPAAVEGTRKGDTPKSDTPITSKTLEDAAVVLLRFYKRTGRRCPTRAERTQLMIGTASLAALVDQDPVVGFRCEDTAGFSLVFLTRAGAMELVDVGNGCHVITIGSRIGPFLPMRPEPMVEDPALSREKRQCFLAPITIFTVCHDGNCTTTDVELWLSKH